MKVTAEIYSPFGSYFYDLNGTEPWKQVLSILWDHSTHFSIVNSQMPYLDLDNIGAKKLKKVKKNFSKLPALKEVCGRGFLAKEWPGTLTSDQNRVLFLGETAKIKMLDLENLNENIFWSGPGNWDDLALYNQNSIIYYSCTHERFGGIFGEKSLFQELSILNFSPARENKWEITGTPIPNSTLEKFLC